MPDNKETAGVEYGVAEPARVEYFEQKPMRQLLNARHRPGPDSRKSCLQATRWKHQLLSAGDHA